MEFSNGTKYKSVVGLNVRIKRKKINDDRDANLRTRRLYFCAHNHIAKTSRYAITIAWRVCAESLVSHLLRCPNVDVTK